MREERALLGDVADRALVGRDVDASRVGDDVAADRDDTAVGCDEADQETKQRRLAAPGRPENGGQRALWNDEVDACEHDPIAVGLRQALTLQLGHRQRTASVRTLPYRLISRYAAIKARTISTPAKGAAAANATVELLVLNSVPSVYRSTGSST